MFISAYDTTACKGFRLENLETEIKKYFLETPPNAATNGDIRFITGEAKKIPQFAHPLIIEKENGQEPTYVFDARNSTRLERGTGRLVINARDEFEFQRLRAALTKHVHDNGLSSLGALANFPMTIFSNWITDAIVRRFGVDASVQMRLQVITSIYFLCMFREIKGEFTEKEKTLMSGMITRITRVPPNEIHALLDRVEPMSSVSDLAHAIVHHSDSIRLQEMNVPLLFMLLRGSWFGFNAQEIISVSLEHTPTLYAVIFAAATKAAFKKTILTKLVERFQRQNHLEDFVRSVLRLPEVQSLS